MGKHNVTNTALHTSLTCIIFIEEVVKGHGELSHCLMMLVDIPTQGEIKAKASEEPIFVNVFNRASASHYHVVEHTTLDSAFLTSEAETATRLEIETTQVLFRILEPNLLALEECTSIKSYHSGHPRGIKTDGKVTDILKRIPKSTTIRATDVMFVKAFLLYANRKDKV